MAKPQDRINLVVDVNGNRQEQIVAPANRGGARYGSTKDTEHRENHVCG